jgi:hypothetical protein
MRAADLRFDRRELDEELRRNRESNEKFQREYSAWFERQSTEKGKRKKPA